MFGEELGVLSSALHEVELGLGERLGRLDLGVLGLGLEVLGITRGVSTRKFVEGFNQSAGTSWMLENRVPHFVSGDDTPQRQIQIWPKGLSLVLEAANASSCSSPVSATALQKFIAAAVLSLKRRYSPAIAMVRASNASLIRRGDA